MPQATVRVSEQRFWLEWTIDAFWQGVDLYYFTVSQAHSHEIWDPSGRTERLNFKLTLRTCCMWALGPRLPCLHLLERLVLHAHERQRRRRLGRGHALLVRKHSRHLQQGGGRGEGEGRESDR